MNKIIAKLKPETRNPSNVISRNQGGPGGNGVFVNGERVTEAHLLDTDQISLGAARLVFHARRVGDTIDRDDNAA